MEEVSSSAKPCVDDPLDSLFQVTMKLREHPELTQMLFAVVDAFVRQACSSYVKNFLLFRTVTPLSEVGKIACRWIPFRRTP